MRPLLRLLGAFALVLAMASPASGQQARDQLVDRQLAYEAADREYEAALAAWRVIEKQWNDAVEDHAQARRADDEDRQNAALTRALDLSRELDSLERRVTDRRTALDRVRTALLTGLDDRMEQLERQLAAARTASDRARIATLLRDLQNQQSQIDDERGDEPAVRLTLMYYPSIVPDPRDTPEDMLGKAQLLRDRAMKADSSMALIDREIVRIEKQLRRSRDIQAVSSELERFGDVQAPGAPGRRPPLGGGRARPDSAGVARETTPEERLQALRLLRLQQQDAKRQFLERAVMFEELVRRIG